jgi:hypothetical protein
LAALAPNFLQVLDFNTFFACPSPGMGLDTYQAMKTAQDRLVRHLAVAVALKLAVLCALWWFFIRGERVDVDVDRAAVHLVASGAPVGTPSRPTPPSGAQP